MREGKLIKTALLLLGQIKHSIPADRVLSFWGRHASRTGSPWHRASRPFRARARCPQRGAEARPAELISPRGEPGFGRPDRARHARTGGACRGTAKRSVLTVLILESASCRSKRSILTVPPSRRAPMWLPIIQDSRSAILKRGRGIHKFQLQQIQRIARRRVSGSGGGRAGSARAPNASSRQPLIRDHFVTR